MANIAKRPDGRWRARYRDETGHEHTRQFARKADAQRWLDEVATSVVIGQYVDPNAGKTTFTAYFAQWAARQVWETGTTKAMELAARTVTFGDLPLNRLRRSHLETWVKAMVDADLAPGTVRTRTNNVRGALRAAVRDRIIAADPSEGLVLPRDRRREAAMMMPTPWEVGRILDAALPHYQVLFALAAFAGLRLGEAAAVQVGDINFLRRTLQVTRQVQRAGGGHVEIRPPKYGSERTLFAPDALLRQLASHIERYCPADRPTRWLFEASPGQPPHQNTVGHAWRTACAKAGVSGLTLHGLRHFYASALIAAGCDVVTVQRALGHAKATTTLNTYAHLWPTAEDRTRQAAADLIATSQQDPQKFSQDHADFLRTKTPS